MKTGPLAIALIKHFESLHDGDLKQVGLQPKMCPAGIWTEGYGHAMIDPKTNKFLKGAENKARAYELSKIKTVEQAEQQLASDLASVYEPRVRKLITRTDLTDDQFGTLVSFAYNCGTHYTGKTSGKTMPFKLWELINNKASNTELDAYWGTSVITGGGVVLPGLVRRRTSEAYLFIHGSNNFKA